MENIHKIKHDRIRSRRAVAPIIATLLMIAIAVIGGVMIYVFTQGFFGNSNITTSPSVDTITMTGYDMRETLAATGITNHANLAVVGVGDIAGLPGIKGLNEEGALYIKNVGQKSYSISRIEVNGRTVDFSSSAAPTAGLYGILTPPNTLACDSVCLTTFQAKNTVLPGEEATLMISFDDGSVPAAVEYRPRKPRSCGPFARGRRRSRGGGRARARRHRGLQASAG